MPWQRRLRVEVRQLRADRDPRRLARSRSGGRCRRSTGSRARSTTSTSRRGGLRRRLSRRRLASGRAGGLSMLDRSGRERVPDLSASAGPPAHAQIEQWLMRLIAEGVCCPATSCRRRRISPTALGVSRMTLRQALGSLEARGVVERIPGRQGGTFIREPKIDVDITGLAGLHRAAAARPGAGERAGGQRDVVPALAGGGGTRSSWPRTPRSTRSSACGRRTASRWRWSGPTCRRSCSRAARAAADRVAVRAAAPGLRLGAADGDGVPRAVHRRPREARLLEVDEGSALLLIERTAQLGVGPPDRVRPRPLPPRPDQDLGADCRRRVAAPSDMRRSRGRRRRLRPWPREVVVHELTATVVAAGPSTAEAVLLPPSRLCDIFVR